MFTMSRRCMISMDKCHATTVLTKCHWLAYSHSSHAIVELEIDQLWTARGSITNEKCQKNEESACFMCIFFYVVWTLISLIRIPINARLSVIIFILSLILLKVCLALIRLAARDCYFCLQFVWKYRIAFTCYLILCSHFYSYRLTCSM